MAVPDDLSNPDADILDSVGLARLMQISAASIASMRSRDPIKLPPPFLKRPLRWRRAAVIKWMEERERIEQLRIDRTYPASMSGRNEERAFPGANRQQRGLTRA